MTLVSQKCTWSFQNPIKLSASSVGIVENCLCLALISTCAELGRTISLSSVAFFLEFWHVAGITNQTNQNDRWAMLAPCKGPDSRWYGLGLCLEDSTKKVESKCALSGRRMRAMRSHVRCSKCLFWVELSSRIIGDHGTDSWICSRRRLGNDCIN